MEGESYEHSLKTEDLKKRGRKGRQATKEEVALENPEDISVEASEDDEPSSHDTRRRSSSNKPSNAKGERKQSNAKGERKPSNPKGERKQSEVVKNKRQTRKTKTMEVEDPSHEDELCEVCYSSVSEPFLNEEMKSLFEMIRCQECDMSVHKICYGYKTHQNAQTFLCDECREGVEDGKCYICGVQEGCLRFIKKDQWVHSVCGITNGTIQYKNVATMEIDLHDFRKETQKLPAIRKCKECENKVETLPTDNDNQEYCHIHCALQTNIPTENQKSHWDVRFSLQNEENLHVYKHFDEKKLMAYIEGLQLKLKDILQKSTIAKETETNQGLFEMKEKKGTRAKRGEKRIERSSEEIEESLTIALETVKEVAKQSYEGMNPVQEKDEDLKIIGGKISLTHEENKTSKNKKQRKTKKTMEEETQGNNYTDQELTNILISLNKEILNPLSILEVYSQNKFSKLRSDLPEFPTLENLSFPELLFFVIVFQIRAEAVSDNLTSAQDLCRLANSAKFLPFTLSSFLRMINEKFYLSVATDILTKPWIALCYPKSAYDPAEKKFSQEIMGRNSDAMITCQQILDLYTKKPCGVVTNQFELGMQYYQNLSFLQEFYNNISGLFEENPRNRSSSPDKNKTPKKGSLLVFPDDLPEVHVSLIMELSAKRSALGFIDDQLEELKLLDKFNNRSAVTLNVDSFFRSAEKSSSSSKKSRLSDSCSKSANSSVNKSMYTELAGKLSAGKAPVHSPVKTENPIRLNPEGLAALNKKVEELYKEKVTEISEKESVVNAEKVLKQMKAKLGSTKNKQKDPEIDSLEGKISKVKLWMMEFREAEKNKQDLEGFFDRMGDLDFRVNEMTKALNYERKWMLWRNTAQNFSAQLSQKNSSLDQQNTKPNIKNLQGIVKEGEELKHVRADDGLLEGLSEKLAMIKQIQAAIKDHHSTLEKLQELEHNLKHINIHFPEAEKLHLKIKLMKEAERISRESVSLDELEEFFKTFNDHIDLIGNYQMQMEIKNHIEQGREIQNKAKDKALISIDSELFEAQEMAQLVKQTRESRMIIDQVKQVEDEVNKVFSLWKIYACLNQDKLPTIEQLENAEFGLLEGKSLKEILQACEELLARNILNLPKERINILKQTLTTFEHKSEFHKKLAKLFEYLDGAILTGCINEIADTMEVEAISQAIEQEELSSDEKIHFIEKAASIAVLSLSNQIYFEMLDQLGLQVGAIFNEMLELAEAKATKINKIHAKVEQIASNIQDLPEQTKAQIATIKQLRERSGWIYGVASNKQARGLVGWKYSDLKHFVEKFEELGIPGHFAICRELTEMLKIGETMKQTYENKYGKLRREALEGKKPAKLGIEDVPQILSFLEGQVCLEDEINEIEEDVRKVVALTKSIENTTQNFLNSLEDNNFEGTGESLKDKLHRFLDVKLALKDRKGDKGLKLLTWLADAEEVMTGKPDLFELQTFEKIRKDGEEWMEKGIKLEKLIEKVDEQIACANLVIDTANELKEVENNAKDPGYTYEVLMEFLNNISSCKVELKEERQYLNNVAHKSKLLKEGVQMMKKEGAKRMTINDLQMKFMEMGSVPILWEEELIFVEQAKNKATKTIEAYADFEKKKSFENLKRVAEHYQKCLLQHEKAEEYEKTYNQVVKNQDILKSKIEEINAFSMTFEELQDLREKAQPVAEYIKENWVQELRNTIFFKLCKALQNTTDLTQVSSQQLNSMIQECNSLTQDDQTKEALAIIQEALPKVESIEREREEEIQRQQQAALEKEREEELQRVLQQPTLLDDYPEPAIEPEFSESSNNFAQYKITDLEDYLMKEQEEKELKKPIEPFTPRTEEEHQYVGAFKKILNSSEDIRVSDLQITTYARCIIATFPEVLDSLDAFARITGRLKTILKYPFTTQRLVRRNFDSAYLSRLIRKEEADLKSYEKRLRDHNGIMNSGEKGLAPHESLTKKLKTDGNAETTPSKELEDDAPALDAKSPNPFTACHIDKLTKTNSDRRNPLKKLLKGEDVSDFLGGDDEDLREHDPYVGGADQEAFSENEEEKEYQGVQPESEIKYDKNLLAKPLKASVGKGQRKDNILYDPDNPTAEPEKTPNNEDHKDPRKRLKNATGSEKLPDFKKMPPGSILRIFDGILRQADGNKGFKTEFFTCDPYNVVNTLPQIVKEGHASLKITGKFSLSKFQAYFNKCLNNFTTKKVKEEVVVSGWIESHVEMYQKELEDIATDLDNLNKVIMISYNESSKIYVLTNKQFNPQWRRLLNFRFKKVQKDSRPYLYYIIIHKPYKLAHDTISLVPDPVPEFGGNLPIFDLNSVHNFEIIKKRHRKADSDDASLLLEQNIDGGDDLWDQQPVISQPTIPRGNKPYSPTMKSLNTKRSWEEIDSGKKSKFNDGLDTTKNGDPTKKIKSEFGFVTKYLGVEGQAKRNHFEPTPAFEEEPFFQQEEEPVGGLDVMVKKMAKMDRADLIRILEDMEEQDIVELATKMDQTMRDNVISILKDLNRSQVKGDNHKIPKRSHKTYQPPQHIKAFYNLFTPEQMNLAKKRVEAGYQVPVKEESLIQTVPEDEEDFGAIIPESSARYPKIVPRSGGGPQMQNKFAFNKSPFAQNNQKPSVPIQFTDKTIQMSKQVYDLLSQIQNTPMQRVIAVNQPKPALKAQTNQNQTGGNKLFLNKFPANKENQNSAGKFNQGLKFTYQKQATNSMKIFNHNKRVSFNN